MMDKQFLKKAGEPAILLLIKHFSLEKYLVVYLLKLKICMSNDLVIPHHSQHFQQKCIHNAHQDRSTGMFIALLM